MDMLLEYIDDFKQLQYFFLVATSVFTAIGTTRTTFRHWGEWGNPSWLWIATAWLTAVMHAVYFFYWNVHNLLGSPFWMINHISIVMVIGFMCLSASITAWVVKDEVIDLARMLWRFVRR